MGSFPLFGQYCRFQLRVDLFFFFLLIYFKRADRSGRNLGAGRSDGSNSPSPEADRLAGHGLRVTPCRLGEVAAVWDSLVFPVFTMSFLH